MANGKWKSGGESEQFAIFHLPFSMQDPFFSILLGGREHLA
jgi:hypothetical protein